MRIFRFRCPGHSGHSYGYIRANYFERKYLRNRIAAGDTGIYEFSDHGKRMGPKNYGAQFCIRAKVSSPPTGYYIRAIPSKPIPKTNALMLTLYRFLGSGHVLIGKK